MPAERLLGNRSRLPLGAILSLRAHLLRRRGTSVLAVLALAASVALAVTVELSTHSLSTALAETADALLGSSQIGVTAGDVGVDDAWIDRLREVPGVRSAAGMVHRSLRATGGNLRLVQQALAHRSIASTTVYAQVEAGALREALRG